MKKISEGEFEIPPTPWVWINRDDIEIKITVDEGEITIPPHIAKDIAKTIVKLAKEIEKGKKEDTSQ